MTQQNSHDKSDLYNLGLALFPKSPVDPSITFAIISGHWVYNNRDRTCFLPYSPMYALEPQKTSRDITDSLWIGHKALVSFSISPKLFKNYPSSL